MINIAILGTGKIIPEAIDAMQASKKFHVANIWARPHSRDKAAALAEKFHVDKFTTNLDEILNDPSIDFVYVGLINSVHYEYAKKFLEAGKNVIVEKPFTSTAAQTKDLIDLALSKNLYLFEAITTLHLPNFYAIRDALPELGKIKIVRCNFSQYSSRYDAYRRGEVAPAFDPKLFGGALMDLNIYNLNFVVALFGMPKRVFYFANRGWNGIDTSGIVTLEYENFIAQCIAAKDSESLPLLSIQGENGYIAVHDTPNELGIFALTLRGKEDVKIFSLNKYKHRMIHEFVEFGETFERGDYSAVKHGLKISYNVMKVATSAAKSSGIVYG